MSLISSPSLLISLFPSLHLSFPLFFSSLISLFLFLSYFLTPSCSCFCLFSCFPNSTPSCCPITHFPAPRLTQLLSSLFTGRKEEAQLGPAPRPWCHLPALLTHSLHTHQVSPHLPPSLGFPRPKPWPLSLDSLRPLHLTSAPFLTQAG